MKILITGCTNNHIGKPHALKYVSTPALLRDGLRAGGHEVDWRPVVPGEKLRRKYDQAIVFYFNPEASNSRYIYGALWALLEFPDALVAIDDWTLGRIFSNTRRVVRNSKLLTEPSFLSPLYREEAKPYLDKLAAKVTDIATGRGHRILLPLFPWGDRARLYALPNLHLLRWFDPSPLVTPLYRDLDRAPDAKRERRWVLGALTTRAAEWVKKQGLSWPVESYGNRTLQQPRLDEIDLVKRYGQVEGVLSFRTSLAGSGWWRLRFVQSAAMACVIAGDPRETLPMGDAFRYAPREIESLSLRDRPELARQQAKTFAEQSFTKKQLIDRLDALVKETGCSVSTHRARRTDTR